MIKIIIVDDHYLFSAGLSAILQQEPDFEVIGLMEGVHEGVDAVLTQRPDIVLMDFNLPDGSGVDATRLILQEYPSCKIVFLTMSDREEDVLAAIRCGAVGYLLKNLNPARLVAALRGVQKGEGALSGAMTLVVMKELARQTGPEWITRGLEDLTQREKDILAELASGKSNQEIAVLLTISENTVKYHVHSILKKLNLQDRKEAARFAREAISKK